MNFNREETNALLEVEQRIERAVDENNAQKVKYYYTVKDYIETNKLTRRLMEQRNGQNGMLISYFQLKTHFLQREMEEYERVNEQSQNRN